MRRAFVEGDEDAALFPTMLAELFARPLSTNETLLEIDGRYWLPLGAVGNAIDAAVGHRIAESVVRRLLADLADQVEAELVLDRDCNFPENRVLPG